VDDASDVAERSSGPGECMHGLAGRHVDERGADLKAGVGQYPGSRVGCALMQIGEHDMLACADPAGNCLADLPGPDDQGDLTHDRVPPGRL
jgi:hypothetical protein